MWSKPVLDMAAGRPEHVSMEECISALVRAGYEDRGERGVPGRRYFRRGSPRLYHVHLVEENGSLWREYLMFRDYLRAHPKVARRFAALKRALAGRFPRNRDGYTAAKSAYIHEILRLAGLD
jgi:GrpB-like predicted nucleotidyltransferase (UPF0157 family)